MKIVHWLIFRSRVDHYRILLRTNAASPGSRSSVPDSVLGQRTQRTYAFLAFRSSTRREFSDREDLGETKKGTSCRNHHAKLKALGKPRRHSGETAGRRRKLVAHVVGKFSPRNLYLMRPKAWRGLRGDPVEGRKHGIKG